VKKKFGIFGPQKIQMSSSSDEKANSTWQVDDDDTTEHSHRVESRLPKVPSKQEVPIFGLKSNKDFIKLNVVDAILNGTLFQRLKYSNIYIYTLLSLQNIHTKLIAPRKQKDEPDYLKKEDYGKVPAYLKEIATELGREKEMLRQFVENTYADGTNKDDTLEELSATERVSLLASLKTRWEELNGEYQKTAHLVELDTLRKKKRKEELEKELDIIEKDIFKLETAKKILIKHT